MNSNLILDTSTNLVSILLELVLLGVFIYYVLKRKSIDGTLLLISAILSILIRPIWTNTISYKTNQTKDN